jgi:hypothetical protein
VKSPWRRFVLAAGRPEDEREEKIAKAKNKAHNALDAAGEVDRVEMR